MNNPLSDLSLGKLFKKHPRNQLLIGTNEGVSVEFKESFGWKSLSEYLKAMASFANRDGGYIIFGVKDKPHTLIGLQGEALKRFESIDNQEWSTNIRDYFSPEIIWDKRTYLYDENVYGIIYTYSAKEKPVICKKDGDELRKAAIYYRYNSQNSEIDYPELHAIIETEKQKINEQWMKTIRQIGDTGIVRTALLDLESGKLTGHNTTLYMDESLMDEISFVQEGSFVETGGNPALRVVGQVQTVVGAQRIVVEQNKNKAINADEIISSFIEQEKVNNPLEFVKQICYQTTGNMPVYYYLDLAGYSIKQAIDYINEVPINSQSKDLLKRRLINAETKYSRITGHSDVAQKKEAYKAGIIDENLVLPSDESELKYCLIALKGLERSEVLAHKDFILNMLYEVYTNYFNNKPYAATKNEYRYALCWIDEALFMPE